MNPSAAASVAIIKAGCDMVIIPPDVDGAYNGLLNAARSGEIPISQIDASVLKILRAKASVGLHKARLVDIEALNHKILDPQSVAVARQVADEAVTLVRENGKVLPLRRKQTSGTNGGSNPYSNVDKSADRLLAIVFTDDVRGEWGREFEQQLKLRAPDARMRYVDPESSSFQAEDLVRSAERAQSVVAVVYSTPTGGRPLNNPAAVLSEILRRAGEKTVVVAMGSPNIGEDLPALQNYLCTFSSTTVSEDSAVRALFGEIPIRGRLPVTIPGIAERGTGIDKPPQVTQGGLIRHVPHRKSSIAR